MKIADLTKEQKQYLVLGTIVVLAVVILAGSGIKVSLSSMSKAESELGDLNVKIKRAEAAIAKSQQEQEQFFSTCSELQQYADFIPPERNYYSWATEIIYAEAYAVAFDISAIDEVTTPLEKRGTADQVKIDSYALRIAARGSYEDVKQFLGRLSENHPLSRVTGLEISRGGSMEVHSVQIFIEWPFNLHQITEALEAEMNASMRHRASDRVSTNLKEQTRKGADAGKDRSQPHPPPPRDRDGRSPRMNQKLAGHTPADIKATL